MPKIKVALSNKKLTKGSPIEARFHRNMREMHREMMRDLKGKMSDYYLPADRKSSDEYGMWELHRKQVELHNMQYKLAMA